MIAYYVPDIRTPSGGIKRLYRHVDFLARNGIDACVVHDRKGFSVPGTPPVPIRSFEESLKMDSTDILVIPESCPETMQALSDIPCRKFAIALGWSYIYPSLPDGIDWRNMNIERVLVVSPFVGDMISWAMGLPVHLIDFGIDPELYRYDADEKRNRIVYIARKAANVECLLRILRSRNPDFLKRIEWKAMAGLATETYAAEVRSARVFLNLSPAEGLLNSCFEAMQAGTIVAGYDSIGGAGMLIGEGERRNAILAQTGDYVTLAMRLEPVLLDMIQGNMRKWNPLIRNGRKLMELHTPEAEEQAILDFWTSIGS
jgi:glycosyltransferase involved in cell wall biosynthesis